MGSPAANFKHKVSDDGDAITGRWVGRVRDAQRPTRHPARHDALRHLLLSQAGIPRRADAGGRVSCDV
ncbi:MAG TPA: hypothetical protein VE288_02900 [Rubrobacteraceae bacterium]|nr:hypothetical protein [Rubrobacteraceae bacterium]